MTPFSLGQRVEYRHSCGDRVFRGNLVGWIAKKHYAVIEDDKGYKGIVRADRLRHIGGCRQPDGKVA
jgi:hypothetical protein